MFFGFGLFLVNFGHFGGPLTSGRRNGSPRGGWALPSPLRPAANGVPAVSRGWHPGAADQLSGMELRVGELLPLASSRLRVLVGSAAWNSFMQPRVGTL